MAPWASNDECGAISPAAFERFRLPKLVDPAESFGGLGMHCCADAEHQFSLFQRIPGFHKNPKTLQAIEDYVRHNKMRLKYFEVWNEVNNKALAAHIDNIEEQRAQAAYLVKSAVTCPAMGIDKYFWFLALDHPAFAYGLLSTGIQPKAVLAAYARLAGFLNTGSVWRFRFPSFGRRRARSSGGPSG
jgi:hypothetical protein